MVWLSAVWSRARALAMRGVDPEADDREVVRRTTLLIYTTGAVGISPIWVVSYLALGRPLSAAIPFAYMVLSAVTFAWSWWRRDFTVVLRSQIAAILVLPIALQWSLGGFASGSVVGVWSFTATMVGLAFYGPRAAAALFGAFAAAMVVSGLAEPFLSERVPPLPEAVTTAFMVLDLVAPLGVATVVLLYLSDQRDRAARRSEELLLNILPASVVRRLRRGEQRIAERYDEATVLFTDIAGFTPFADRTSADVLVELLDRAYSALDDLVERLGLEKIKTVGDAYMVVGGVPVPRADHAEAIADFALAVAPTLHAALGDAWPGLELRIGIDSGPVAAGVIGQRRLAFGVWGDTVNTASRMESTGVPGAIQVTERAHARLQEHYAFEARGEIEVKGKGPMTTYLLLGPKPTR